MKLQQMISEALQQVGREQEARDVLTMTEPWLIRRYGLIAIENATSETRFEIAYRVKLALDDPANGGPGLATDYEIRKHAHPFKPDCTIYRVYNSSSGEHAGLVSEDREKLLKAAMAQLIVKSIAYNDKEISPCSWV